MGAPRGRARAAGTSSAARALLAALLLIAGAAAQGQLQVAPAPEAFDGAAPPPAPVAADAPAAVPQKAPAPSRAAAAPTVHLAAPRAAGWAGGTPRAAPQAAVVVRAPAAGLISDRPPAASQQPAATPLQSKPAPAAAAADAAPVADDTAAAPAAAGSQPLSYVARPAGPVTQPQVTQPAVTQASNTQPASYVARPAGPTTARAPVAARPAAVQAAQAQAVPMGQPTAAAAPQQLTVSVPTTDAPEDAAGDTMAPADATDMAAAAAAQPPSKGAAATAPAGAQAAPAAAGDDERPPWEEPAAPQPAAPAAVRDQVANICDGMQGSGTLSGAKFAVCNANGWLPRKGIQKFYTFDVEPSEGPFDVRLMMEAVGGHAVMDLWLPTEDPGQVPPRFRATNLLISHMSQESFIRVRSQVVALNAGQFTVRVAAERGSPRFSLSLAVSPSGVRLAKDDADALAAVQADCCGDYAAYTTGPCKTLSDALAAAAAPLGPVAAAGSICHHDASLCDAEGHLLELVLRNPNPAAGPGLRCSALSQGFASLPLLQRLTLEGSDLGATAAGAARALAGAPVLEWLVLRRVGLAGPLACELMLGRMRVLDLSDNNLEGPLPDCYLDNDHLLHLYVSNNRLSGPMPAVGAMSKLNFLSAAGQAAPAAPPGGGAGPAGQQAPAAGGGFTALPPNLGDARALAFLDVAQSRIQGQMPALNASMRFLNVSLNNLAGAIPELPPAMTHFDAAYNQLEGGLPDTLGAAVALMLLNVSGNPTLGPTNLPAKLPPALKALSAASAGLQGPLPADALPPALWFLDLSGNQLSGPVPEGGLQGDVLEAVDLSNNRFIGDVPAWFALSPTLRMLNLSGNGLSGFSDADAWDTPLLATLDLSRNGLQGSLPARLALQRRLAFLDVSHNKLVAGLQEFAGALAPHQVTGAYFDVSDNLFTGPLPPGLKNLAVFDAELAPAYPTSQFPYGTQAKAFDVSGNMLDGPMPAFMWTMLPAAAAAACPPAAAAGACPNMRVGVRGLHQTLVCPPAPASRAQVPSFTPDEELAMQQLLVTCVDSNSGRLLELMSVLSSNPESLEDAEAGITSGPARDDGSVLPAAPVGSRAGGGGGSGGGAPRLSAGAVAGLVVGVLAAVALVGGAGFVIGRRRQIAVSLQRFERFEDAAAAPPPGAAAPGAAAGAGGVDAATASGGPAHGRGSPADLRNELGGTHMV